MHFGYLAAGAVDGQAKEFEAVWFMARKDGPRPTRQAWTKFNRGMFRSVRFQPYSPLGHWRKIFLKGHGVSDGALLMNTREYLLKAQQADAVAYTVESSRERCRWEEVAAEYRRLAKTVAVIRQDSDKDLHRLA